MIITEIFCVVLGWVLAQATTFINDTRKSRKYKIALLTILLEKLTSDFSITKEIFLSNAFQEPYYDVDKWWENNKLRYYEEFPTEASLFNKWHKLNTSILEWHNKKLFNHYASVTAETRNSLQQTLQHWQQPLWKLFLYLLTHTE